LRLYKFINCITNYDYIIDTSIIRTQIKNINFKQSFTETTNDYLNKKIKFGKPFSIMIFVYSSTYSTANLTEFYCKIYNIDYKVPTLILTSIVNIFTIAYKDKEYSKIFNNKYHIFPRNSFCIFAIRYMFTISSSFIFRATRILNADFISKKIRTLPPKRRIN